MAELLSILTIVFDSGTLVLIWMVQLVIYPSFKYYALEDLKSWHKIYTSKVTIIVLPLMLGQLLLGIFSVVTLPSALTISRLVIIVLLWAITFLIFVPLHSKIDIEQKTDSAVLKLNSKNWSRTILWTVLFTSNFIA